MGQAIYGLYLLQCESLQNTPSSSLTDFLVAHKLDVVFHPFSTAISHCNSYFLWQARLGHPSDPKLHALSHVIPSLQFSSNKECQVCPMAKLKRLLFPFNNKISDCPFDLVHMDGVGTLFYSYFRWLQMLLNYG